MAKLNDTTINGKLTVSNINGYTIGPSGWFGQIPVVKSNDGVMEVGHYIDFHMGNATTRDYDGRLTAVSGGGELTFPTKNGIIALISDVDECAKLTSYNIFSGTNNFTGETHLNGLAVINKYLVLNARPTTGYSHSIRQYQFEDYLDFTDNGTDDTYNRTVMRMNGSTGRVEIPGSLTVGGNEVAIKDSNVRHLRSRGYASSVTWIRIGQMDDQSGKFNITGSIGTYDTNGCAHIDITLECRDGKAVFGTMQTKSASEAFGRVDFGLDNNRYVYIKRNAWYDYDIIISIGEGARFVDQTVTSAPSWILSNQYTVSPSHLVITDSSTSSIVTPITKSVKSNFIAMDVSSTFSSYIAGGVFTATANGNKSITFARNMTAAATGTKYTLSTPNVIVCPVNYAETTWIIYNMSSSGFTIWSSKASTYRYIAFGAA